MKIKTDKKMLPITIFYRSPNFVIEEALSVAQENMICLKNQTAFKYVFCGDIKNDLKENNHINRRMFCNTLLLQGLQACLKESHARETTMSKI